MFGILVMMVPASILTVTEVVEGNVVSVNEGIVKFFGDQLSKKNPIVFAVAGSVGFGSVYFIVSDDGVTGGCGAGLPGFFLHDRKKNPATVSMVNKKDFIVSIVDLTSKNFYE